MPLPDTNDPLYQRRDSGVAAKMKNLAYDSNFVKFLNYNVGAGRGTSWFLKQPLDNQLSLAAMYPGYQRDTRTTKLTGTYQTETNAAARVPSIMQKLGTTPKKPTATKTTTRTTSRAAPIGTSGGGVKIPGMPTTKVKLPGVNYKQTADDLARAKDLIALEFGPQEGALNRERTMAGRDYERLLRDLNEQMGQGIAGQQRYGELADARLQEIYNALQGELEQNVGATRDIYSRGQGQLGEAYGQSIQNQQGQAQDVISKLSAEAERLGLAPAQAQPVQDLSAQLAKNVAGEESAQAAAKGNLSTLGTQMEAIGQQGIGASRRELAQERANVVNDVSGAISQLQIERGQGARKLSENLQDQLLDIGMRLSELATRKGPALREAVRQVTEARSERERQARLDTLAEKIQLATLDIQKGEFGLKQAELGMRQQEFQAGQNMLPLEQQKLEAEIRRINAETGALGAKTGTGSDEAGAFQRLDAKINSNPTRYDQRARDAITQIIFTAKDAREAAAMANPFASQLGIHPQILNELIWSFYGG